MKRVLLFLTGLLFVLHGYAYANWRMHTTFDGDVTRIIDTPTYTYFTVKTVPSKSGYADLLSLFRYDKEGEELQSLSTDNILSNNIVHNIQYNPQKGYVIVVYANYDIDFIYDDGSVVNCPSYMLASMSYPKNVNGITVNNDYDCVYMATDFGYVCLNDKKHEILESRIYGEPFTSVARIGDSLIVIKDGNLLTAQMNEPRMSLADYEAVENVSNAYLLAPLAADKCLVGTQKGGGRQISTLDIENKSFKFTPALTRSQFYNVENNKSGVLMTSSDILYQFLPDGTFSTVALPEEDSGLPAGSYNLSEIWRGKARKGFKSGRPGADGVSWTLTRDYMLPDSPSPFLAPHMAVHPREGLLVMNNGFGFNGIYPSAAPMLLSSYKGMSWSNLSPAYTYPDQTRVLCGPNGFAIDPDNSDLIYVTSTVQGIVRINLSDPSDIIHLSKPTDTAKDFPGFVEFVPQQTGINAWSCRFSAPVFDAYGNLWMCYTDFDNQTPPRIHIYCWEAEARRSTTSASNVILPKKIEVEGFTPTNNDRILPLKYNSHRNYLVYTQGNYGNQVVVIDTNGTPLDTSDDKVATISQYVDQDGTQFTSHSIRFLKEDPSTGNVWVGSINGLFYFNPDDVLNGNPVARRVKVSRNDGTNLADRLLEGVEVYQMETDGYGRKWFATVGGGLVCTSSDGRTIEEEINSSNSPLPDDAVYGIAYVPANNSMMIATAQGIAEYFLSGGSSGGDEESVKIYPNPVRPDYLGYVTIEGAPSGGIVKIVDASGNIVKELGRSNSSDLKWDVTNHQFKRVSSGVYYVLASSGDADTAFATVGKILVVN